MRSLRESIIALGLFLVGVLAVRSGVQAPLWTSALFVILFSIPLLLELWRSHRIRGLIGFGVIGIFAIVIETIGLITGFPYGEFVYGGMLGPQLPGGAPLLLPFAYVPLVFGAIALVRAAPGMRVLLAALLLVAIDLVLDPGAVAFGLWSFSGPAFLHGVPLSNFIGWLISGSIAVVLANLFVKPTPQMASTLLLHLAFWTGVVSASDYLIPTMIGVVLLIFTSRSRPFSSSRSVVVAEGSLR